MVGVQGGGESVSFQFRREVAEEGLLVEVGPKREEPAVRVVADVYHATSLGAPVTAWVTAEISVQSLAPGHLTRELLQRCGVSNVERHLYAPKTHALHADVLQVAAEPCSRIGRLPHPDEHGVLAWKDLGACLALIEDAEAPG